MGPMLLYLILAVMKIKKRNKKKIMSKLNYVLKIVSFQNTSLHRLNVKYYLTQMLKQVVCLKQKMLFVTLGKQHLSR